MIKRILESLLESGVIDSSDVDYVLNAAANDKDTDVIELILSLYDVDDDLLSETVAKASGLPSVKLYQKNVPRNVAVLFDSKLLAKYAFFPFELDEKSNVLSVAVSDPLDMRVRNIVYSRGYGIRVFITSKNDIFRAIDHIYGSESMNITAGDVGIKRRESAEKIVLRQNVRSSPIVRLVDQTIESAVRRRASDIHIEPQLLSKRVRVRYRIDGMLTVAANHDISLLSPIVARIKVLCGCDLVETRLPQDGQFEVTVDGRDYDIRVSIIPTVNGEKCMLRVSPKRVIFRGRETLGFTESDLVKFDRILSRPNGLVLVTGPTGSGKTTTMYTALGELMHDGINIVTAEDPVEAMIEGINQVHVTSEGELNFSMILRSILRQDPDVILIGEIRDEETARIAVQASITGQLVMSTLHTNDTARSVTRLRDMGIENYLIADSVVGIIAERLVRVLCPECKRERRLGGEEAEYLNLTEDEARGVVVYDAVGCQKCSGTGYYGRRGVFEVMEITSDIRGAVAEGKSSAEIKQIAQGEGMTTLDLRMRELVLSGVTSMQEIKGHLSEYYHLT